MTEVSSTDEKSLPPLRMDAYYYGFGSTGVREIDLVLSAVACAGKAYHGTESWMDDCEPYPGHTGDCPVNWIANAAVAAAAEITRLRGVLRAIKDATAQGAPYDSPAVYNTADGALRGLVQPVEVPRG